LSGASEPLPARIEAKLGASLPANGDRLDHVRGVLCDGIVYPTGSNDSSMLAALSKSNVLIVRNINASEAAAGDSVTCFPLT
jgi:molybdopterin molybdotransferase